ncbi:regulator of G-protein signaling 12 isoform X1 [Paramormyrops kingsleyae]|uniref:regulator of G-protein signaling 12 isoform X1 n=2 Tax=Paramormyrops kingsleyae TaxID=1676925 RepID=UPI000CD60A59|nr:regulator of G-protein signaling 12-like isoform X1 [Paramormyrops kingsleyae]
MSFKKRLSFRKAYPSSSALSGGAGMKVGTSEVNLNSGERSVGCWAAGFERLLQDPQGIHYFSEFLKKEFSEENILFWQACESFSHLPENDKKQLSQKACEIYSSFLSSQATTPVNIDSRAQLADDVLNAPRPDMFHEPQLQIFNLMKFDSYTRFLRSSLYRDCMLAEVEGRSMPDPQKPPSSPVLSKHSAGSDHSSFSTLTTPRKEGKKLKPTKAGTQDHKEEHTDKKRGIFSSWTLNTSFGKGSKKADLGEYNHADFSSSNGRRESRGSLSSGTSLELVSGTEAEPRPSGAVCDKAMAQCTVNLPDGSRYPLAIRPGVSIRELLLELCEKLHINLASVDLFLVGGEKPLVLDQDCITLSTRDLRLEKRTLFRLDLVPINRSVGLKAKPNKPVTEVLRPVVAKYGFHLSDLVARVSGESGPLDFGAPISSLDGCRVVLDVPEHASKKEDKQKSGASGSRRAPPLTTRSRSSAGDERPGKSGCVMARGGSSGGRPFKHGEKKKINIDEAEEFFELLSRAQSCRADDQRGLLTEQILVLPDFLRTPADPKPEPEPKAVHPTPASRRSTLTASRNFQSLDSTLPVCGNGPSSTARPLHAPPSSRSPAPFLALEEESEADLAPVADGDVSGSPLRLPPEAPSRSEVDARGGSGCEETHTPTTHHKGASSPALPAGRVIDVDGVRLEDASDRSPDPSLCLGGLMPDLRGCQGRTRSGMYQSSDLSPLLSVRAEESRYRPGFL